MGLPQHADRADVPVAQLPARGACSGLPVTDGRASDAEGVGKLLLRNSSSLPKRPALGRFRQISGRTQQCAHALSSRIEHVSKSSLTPSLKQASAPTWSFRVGECGSPSLSALPALTRRINRCDIATVTTPNDEMQLTIAEPSKKESAAGVVARFRHDSEDGWTVAGAVSRGPSGHVISHIEVWPGRPGDAPGGSVTTRMLHEIRVGQIINAVRYWEMRTKVRAMASRLEYEPGDERAEHLLDEVFREPLYAPGSKVTIRTADEILSASAPEKPQPGRAPLPDELLREVAEGYLAESAPGKPRGAVKRLAEHLGRSENTVSRWVSKARKDGWLGPGRQGHEGAEPGPRLLAARTEGSAE